MTGVLTCHRGAFRRRALELGAGVEEGNIGVEEGNIGDDGMRKLNSLTGEDGRMALTAAEDDLEMSGPGDIDDCRGVGARKWL